MKRKEIAVSIIIPVYNRENLIERCLDSVINQTLDSIEIIIVDDGSVDNTVNVIKNYTNKYEGEIKLICQNNNGAANARNTGIKNASGKYITFVDSDDYIDFDAMEIMYNKAIETDADIVCAPLFLIENNKCKILGRYNGEENDKEEIINQVTSNLYNKVYKRDFVLKTNFEIPNFILGEDTCFVYSLLSWADRITYVDKAYYYYELSENSLSNNDIERPWLVENVEMVKEWAMSHANPYYRDIINVQLCRRFLHIFGHNERYQPELVNYLRNNKKYYLEIKKDDRKRIKNILYKTFNEIPKRIIINGFDKEKLLHNDNIHTIKKWFCEDYELLVLNNENCDINENIITKDAFHNRDYDFLGAFFALYEIKERGGIFLGNEIVIRDNINQVRNNEAFFVFENMETISSQIFGSCPNASIINDIYEKMIKGKYISDKFQFITKIILNTIDGMHFEDKTIVINGEFSVYCSGMFCFPQYGQKSLAIYKKYMTESIMADKFLLQTKSYIEKIKNLSDGKNYWKNRCKLIEENSKECVFENRINLLLEENQNLGKEIIHIQNSISYRLGMFITFVPRMVRRIVKRLVRGNHSE